MGEQLPKNCSRQVCWYSQNWETRTTYSASHPWACYRKNHILGLLDRWWTCCFRKWCTTILGRNYLQMHYRSCQGVCLGEIWEIGCIKRSSISLLTTKKDSGPSFFYCISLVIKLLSRSVNTLLRDLVYVFYFLTYQL